ncbi:MAG: Putative DNA-binding protein in cluster with Type I restriction-modification system [uncultured Campylobacterales bacterium]|uniref:DNA-binding protein in cluster with Type I restriction-modification system n=1 Tax=uncultured Campylobacterales bacterium TaxID=352960 RepID=A0A6S6ST30_9BACT|nr:MAG: Putative DNA-binding protein in cluster with Type I restriction-modification system [uncultured Campylobacterales bacterium]
MQNKISEFLLYTTPNDEIKVEILASDGNVWLPQKRMAELFGVQTATINEHLKNIYKSQELKEDSTIRNFLIVQTEGNREVQRNIAFYNLDAILSVGYRVNSLQATQFRIWASNVLKEYIIKGFTMDDDRLAHGKKYFGKDYFKELLERVRSIRASERRIYQQITDIFAECTRDYNKHSEISTNFYATIQNKFHYAITGHTASEIIYKKVDNKKPYMGMTNWKNSPKGRILKSDTIIAKNYLSQDEIKSLERAISGYFDYIERLIENKTDFTMQQVANSVNKFLEFNEYEILEDNGKISKAKAKTKAHNEYDKFNKTQKIESDFDKKVMEDIKQKFQD